MRALSILLNSSCPLLFHTTNSLSPSRFQNPNPTLTFQFQPSSKSLSSPRRKANLCCSSTDSTSSIDTNQEDYNDDDYDGDSNGNNDDIETNLLSADGVYIEIRKTGRNSRRICSKIGIEASLDTIWRILTDYENLANFIPGLAVSKLMEKKGNCARLYQIGQQDLPLGLKFNAKGVLDCYEKDLQSFPSSQRREIDFKMIEGDFQLFKGKWSIEQFNKGEVEEGKELLGKEFLTTLAYVVDVKPKLWLPVRVIEGRLCNDIKTNLSCVREEAEKGSRKLSL